jgi:hypothetical protein
MHRLKGFFNPDAQTMYINIKTRSATSALCHANTPTVSPVDNKIHPPMDTLSTHIIATLNTDAQYHFPTPPIDNMPTLIDNSPPTTIPMDPLMHNTISLPQNIDPPPNAFYKALVMVNIKTLEYIYIIYESNDTAVDLELQKIT